MADSQLSLFGNEPGPPTLRDVAEAVKAAGIDGLPGAARRADQVRYQEVQVRSAVTETRGMPFFRWALNPYRGCTHACEYCYARKYQRHLELDAGADFSTVILVKTNLPAMLARDLARSTWARELVAVGTATDPYQPIEGHYRLTRRCLDLLVDARTPFSIVTKGSLVVRDLDILRRATAGAGCRVYISVPSVDPAASALLEPGTPPPSQRLRAAKQLTDAGIDTAVMMMPLVPGITTTRRSVRATMDAIERSGLRFAGMNVAHLEPGVREHFMAFLEREYPGLVAGYERLYSGRYAPHDYTRRVRAVVQEEQALARAEVRSRPVAGPVLPPTTGCER